MGKSGTFSKLEKQSVPSTKPVRIRFIISGVSPSFLTIRVILWLGFTRSIFKLYEEVSPLNLRQNFRTLAGSVGRLFGGISSNGSIDNTLSHHFQLLAEHEQLESTDKNKTTREKDYPPIGRRFAVAILLVCAGSYLCFTENSYLSWAGYVMACSGMLLWFITGFQWSWSWPL